MEEMSIQIFVRTINGATRTLDLMPSDSIYDLKMKIQDKEGIPPSQQNITFNGRPLTDNEMTVEECKIHEISTIQLLLALGRTPQLPDYSRSVAARWGSKGRLAFDERSNSLLFRRKRTFMRLFSPSELTFHWTFNSGEIQSKSINEFNVQIVDMELYQPLPITLRVTGSEVVIKPRNQLATDKTYALSINDAEMLAIRQRRDDEGKLWDEAVAWLWSEDPAQSVFPGPLVRIIGAYFFGHPELRLQDKDLLSLPFGWIRNQSVDTNSKPGDAMNLNNLQATIDQNKKATNILFGGMRYLFRCDLSLPDMKSDDNTILKKTMREVLD
jgi:hypothetical protein